MICSSARMLANQANARRSTGPKTEEGKARSRGNALKHGLAGQGVVLPEDAAAEVARRIEELQAELRPTGTMGRIMVQRIARLSVKLERSCEHELASTARAVRHAKDDHDDRRQAEVEALLESLGERPAASVRGLLRTPEGIDALEQAWVDLKADLGRGKPRFWTLAHAERADNLTGRRIDDVPLSRISMLSRASWGDFGFLDDHEGAGLDESERKVWAREQLLVLIDEELEALRECRETLDLEIFELDREEAGQRALFDPSREATLARRYEATAERGMFRALEEFRRIEAEASEAPAVSRPAKLEPLGSFGAGAVGPIEDGERPERKSRPTPNCRIRPALIEVVREIDPVEGALGTLPGRFSTEEGRNSEAREANRSGLLPSPRSS